jgi:1,4-alpha-glucan branching enzyme
MPPNQPISERFPSLQEQEVVLTFFAPSAKAVRVAGTFNGWRPEANPLEREETGEWATRLRLKSGQYEYRFVVDGIWAGDPKAEQHATNPHGELNSVLRVGLDDTTDFL